MERLDEVAAATKEKAAEELPAADIVRLASDAGPEHEGRVGKTFAKRGANGTNEGSPRQMYKAKHSPNAAERERSYVGPRLDLRSLNIDVTVRTYVRPYVRTDSGREGGGGKPTATLPWGGGYHLLKIKAI